MVCILCWLFLICTKCRFQHIHLLGQTFFANNNLCGDLCTIHLNDARWARTPERWLLTLREIVTSCFILLSRRTLFHKKLLKLLTGQTLISLTSCHDLVHSSLCMSRSTRVLQPGYVVLQTDNMWHGQPDSVIANNRLFAHKVGTYWCFLNLSC